MRVKYRYILLYIRRRYNLDAIVSKYNYIYIRIQKGMPRLKQAAILAHKHLKHCLLPYGYELIYSTLGLWHYKTKPTKFCLYVSDFSIKYWSKEDAEHLCNAIGASHWNYKLGYVDISILKAILSILKKLNHMPKVSLQHSPHCYRLIKYGKKGIQ